MLIYQSEDGVTKVNVTFMDDERLKQLSGGNYWKELLDRIRDISSSEYNPKCAESDRSCLGNQSDRSEKYEF